MQCGAVRGGDRDLYFLRGAINLEFALARGDRLGKQRLGDSVPHVVRVRADTDI